MELLRSPSFDVKQAKCGITTVATPSYAELISRTSSIITQPVNNVTDENQPVNKLKDLSTQCEKSSTNKPMESAESPFADLTL